MQNRIAHFLGKKSNLLGALILSLVVSVTGVNTNVWANAVNENNSVEAETRILHSTEVVGADYNEQNGYDIVYVIDCSGSIKGDLKEYRNQAFKAISTLSMGTDNRVGVVYYGGDVKDNEYLNLQSMDDDESVKKVFEKLNNVRGDMYTYIGGGLEKALEIFEDQDANRNRVIVLFSDGMDTTALVDGAVKNAKIETDNFLTNKMDKNIPIYCIFLDDGKTKADEEYLKRVVIYNANKDENGKDRAINDEEASIIDKRYVKVDTKDVRGLSEAFINVFSSFEGRMKLSRIELDDNYEKGFYIPSLGVEEVKIYCEGEFKNKPTVYNNTTVVELEPQWVGNNSYYYSIKKPSSGDWTIKAEGMKYGTITYLSDVYAGAEIVADQDGGKSLVVSLYDSTGTKIAMDSVVNVDLVMNCYSDGENNPKKISVPVKIKDGVAVSDALDLSGYGKYIYDIRVTYGDFIDLGFSLDGIVIKKNAPIFNDITNGEFKSDPVETGYEFSFSEDELWTDLEGEKVTVTGITQLIDTNPVQFVQRDGYVLFTAESRGRVKFEVSVEDSSGMITKGTIEGRVIDSLFFIKIAIVLCVCLVLIVVWGIKTKPFYKIRVRKSIRQESILSGVTKEFNEEYTNFVGKQKQETDIIKCFRNKYATMSKVSASLSLEEKLILGVSELDDISASNVESVVNIADIEECEKCVEDLINEVKEITQNSERTYSRDEIAIIKNNCYEIEQRKEELANVNAEIADNIVNIQMLYSNLEECITHTKGLLENEIKYNIVVENISAMASNVHVGLSCKSDNGEYKRGFIMLEEARILGQGYLKDILVNLGIYILGTEKGIELKSLKEFEVRTNDTESRIVKAVKINRGDCCDITVECQLAGTTNSEAVDMVIRVV